MSDLEPLVIDRDLSKVAKRWVSFRRKLRVSEGVDLDPFEASRRTLGKTTFDALLELPHDPVAPSIARWLYRLTEQRINRTWLLAIAEARNEHPLEAGHETSHRELIALALSQPARRRDSLNAALERAEPIHNLVAGLWERRRAIAEQVLPKAERPAVGYLADPAPNVQEVAEAWLDTTGALLEAPGTSRTPDWWMKRALGEVDPGWPAHLNPHSLSDMFRETKLLDGLDLDPGPLPRAMAPSSYLRALARLGAAWLVANAPRDQPFAIAHDAYGLERLRYGALFGSLPLSTAFLSRRLGATRELAQRASRSCATILLIHSRIAALRVLLGRAALEGRAVFGEAFAEGVHRCLGIELPRTAAGAFIRLRLDDAQRFAALLTAFDAANRLREAHDEDWFRNPRAIDQLRSEATLPPAVSMEPETLRAALSHASATLLELLK